MTVAFATVLAASGAVVAQDGGRQQPFEVQDPFAAGETWRLRTELTTTERPVQQQVDDEEAEQEVTEVTWTESAAVEERSVGFALRSTLTSWRMDSQAPNAESHITYDEDDLTTIRVGEGREEDFARTWTYEFDPSWRLLDVSGQRQTIDQLYQRAMADMSDREDGCGEMLGRWLGRTFGPLVVDRISERLEERLIRSNREGLAPVRIVMERLRATGVIEPDFEARVAAAGDLPAGTVRFRGVGEEGAEFEVEFDVQQAQGDEPVNEYWFVIDDAGRLAHLEAASTRVEKQGDRDVRVTSRFAYALEEVTPPAEGGDEGDEGVDTGEQQPPRSRPRPF